jgi:hypothetical protein
MDKELIWKVLTEEQGCKLSGEDCTHRKCRRYLTCKGMVSAITTLFKQEMLRLIGEDEDKYLDTIYSELARVERGKNQLRAELRNAINTEISDEHN